MVLPHAPGSPTNQVVTFGFFDTLEQLERSQQDADF